MPNSFSESYGTHGILENNRIYNKVGSGRYYVPTDWSIWLIYNPTFGGGEIKFKHWVEDYTSDDVGRINGEWQPTGTEYIDADAARRKEEERIAAEAKIKADLEAELAAAKAAADESERLRLQKEAEAKEEKAKLELEAQLAKEEAERLIKQKGETATIDKTEVVIEYPDATGLHFNLEMILLIVAIGCFLCCCGCGLVCWIQRRNKQRLAKEEAESK